MLPIEQSHQAFILQSGKEDPLSNVPKEALDELINLYFEYIDPSLPIIHKRSFLETISTESPLLLNAMYALAARYSNHTSILSLGSMFGGPVTSLDEVKQRACDVFYFKARDLVDQYMDFAKVSTISAFLLLKSLCAASGRISASWMYSGMAISMLKEMRRGSNTDDDALATESDGSLDWLEHEKRRRLWWACYVGDRYAAAASDRPMIMQDSDCKVHFPCSPEDWVAGFSAVQDSPTVAEEKKRQITDFSSTSAFIPNLSSQTYHGYYILLSKIFGQIIDFTKVYKTTTGLSEMVAAVASGTAQQPPPRNQIIEQTDVKLSVLETSLKSWHAFLPEHYKAINYDVQLANTTQPKEIYLLANLQIYYRLCTIFLHKPKLMNLLRTTQVSRHHSTIPKHPSFLSCHKAASEVTQILDMIRGCEGEQSPGKNPNLTHFYPFVSCFAIFQSALVHLMAGQICCNGAGGVRKALVHASALKGLSRDWGLAAKLYSSLAGLIDVAREASLNGEGIFCTENCPGDAVVNGIAGAASSSGGSGMVDRAASVPSVLGVGGGLSHVPTPASSSASSISGGNSKLGPGLHTYGAFGGMGEMMMNGGANSRMGNIGGMGQARIEEVFESDFGSMGGGAGASLSNGSGSASSIAPTDSGPSSDSNIRNMTANMNMWGGFGDLNRGSGGVLNPSSNMNEPAKMTNDGSSSQQYQQQNQQFPAQHQQHQQLQPPNRPSRTTTTLAAASVANTMENGSMWNPLNTSFGDLSSNNGFI
ncbi:UNVERIFIED_CONTAM: hypothetical protein HDU68_001050 [Siphonaria sp. JEL0065]|nr:hypothetical protein HDU68_001050 [Siphonaria sp. JEL0065]